MDINLTLKISIKIDENGNATVTGVATDDPFTDTQATVSQLHPKNDTPTCSHGEMRYIPEGKRANGSIYTAFWACTHPDYTVQCRKIPA